MLHIQAIGNELQIYDIFFSKKAGFPSNVCYRQLIQKIKSCHVLLCDIYGIWSHRSIFGRIRSDYKI